MFNICSMRKPLKQLYKLLCCQIDYCNSIYQGATTYAINKHQRLQNMGCRKIKRLGKYDHITPHIMELHWLKIKECIVYKVCVLMYKCIKGLAPQYLSEVIIKDHGHSLRSTTFNNLPTVRCSTGPRLWNMLSNDIKSSSDLEVFRTRLKTFLFNVSYDSHQ